MMEVEEWCEATADTSYQSRSTTSYQSRIVGLEKTEGYGNKYKTGRRMSMIELIRAIVAFEEKIEAVESDLDKL